LQEVAEAAGEQVGVAGPAGIGQEVKNAIFLAVRDLDAPAARKRWEALEEAAASRCPVAVPARTG
jgi:hypothetical protein